MPIAQERLRHIQTTLRAWFEQYGRDLPWRRTRDPYHILVSEIMLQQTQVDRVQPKYHAFLERFPTLEALASASPGDVIRAWAGLGYNRRALNLQRATQAVINDYGGIFPSTPDELRQLPGIGPYTAGAVACFAFERDVAFMDTNIRRVIRRVFSGPDDDAPPASERELTALATAAVPPGDGYTWNQAIMELGALVCTAKRPRCAICPLQHDCRAFTAWKQADEQIFHLQPATRSPVRRVAERSPQYVGSNRFFRGKLVALLRDLPAGTTATLEELGPQVKAEWTTDDLAWLQTVAEGLAADGLIAFHEEEGTNMPCVSLP